MLDEDNAVFVFIVSIMMLQDLLKSADFRLTD